MPYRQPLLITIAHCPNVTAILSAPDPNHPCHKIVASQKVADISSFQVPEPWNGDLANAPILFLSSNPSISEAEEYPTYKWPDQNIADFFTNRFGAGLKNWVIERKRGLNKDGSRSKATPFWAEVGNRADELLGRSAAAGADYALTEVVHCKSRNRLGVSEALEECIRRHLDLVLGLSGARLLVVVGEDAGNAIRDYLHLMGQQVMHGPIPIAGKERFALFLGAPGSAKPRRLVNILDPEQFAAIRSILAI